ncbi:MAG: PhzF family phenazine biosynthesis protein [Alphaproteobacteria bacterium]|nr:PhzF family phenazine biosynthesis protein [Alphaproteobacteria bacterium]
MKLAFYWVDAFTDRVFRGNPAAVVPLWSWIDDGLMQAIAAENNLSETAFFVPKGDGFHLRWFSPTTEVPLCGHATLAAGHVVLHSIDPARKAVLFDTLSGKLGVQRDGDLLALDFPTRPPEPLATPPAGLAAALRAAVVETHRAGDNLLVVLGSEAAVRELDPDMRALAALDERLGYIVTAAGTTVDFVSRYFAPQYGIPEDPVTGSAHCTLTPYWAKRLGKTRLEARQVSRRGGALTCTLLGDRVSIAGGAVTYLTGTLDVPARA